MDPLTETESFVNRVPLDVWAYEEENALEKHNPQLYQHTCQTIKNEIKEILELKMKNISPLELAEKRIETSLIFISLASLNRFDKLQAKIRRVATNEAKCRIDCLQVQLENLLFEKRYFENQTYEYLGFESKHDEIELAPIEEFYRAAPMYVANDDQHRLMLGRLNLELEQRQRLVEEFKEGNLLREKLDFEVKTKQEYLDKLVAKLKMGLRGFKPLQDHLDMSV